MKSIRGAACICGKIGKNESDDGVECSTVI